MHLLIFTTIFFSNCLLPCLVPFFSSWLPFLLDRDISALWRLCLLGSPPWPTSLLLLALSLGIFFIHLYYFHHHLCNIHSQVQISSMHLYFELPAQYVTNRSPLTHVKFLSPLLRRSSLWSPKIEVWYSPWHLTPFLSDLVINSYFSFSQYQFISTLYCGWFYFKSSLLTRW